MKFKDILVLADIDKTMDFLREHYYADMEEKKREAQIIGYNKVVADLMTTTPVDRVSGEFDTNPNPHWRIAVEWYEPNDDWKKKFPEDTGYWNVHARNGTLNKESSDYEYWKDTCTDEEFLNSEITYAIEFTPWNEWLGMDIEPSTLENLSYEEILGHCLWEMTFVSWDQNEIKEKIEDLGKMVDDYKSGKNKGTTFKSVDEMMEHLKDKLEREEE